jgi:hypothetical protein
MMTFLLLLLLLLLLCNCGSTASLAVGFACRYRSIRTAAAAAAVFADTKAWSAAAVQDATAAPHC